MATKSSNEDPQPEPQNDPQPETQKPEDPPAEAPETTETAENFYQLPPAMAEAGGVGVVGLTSGIHTVSNGSYLVSPGTPMLLSPEDAQTLIDQGVVVAFDKFPLPA